MAKKYIDAEKLITEIERLQHLNECYKRNWRWKFKWFSHTVIGRMEVLEGIKNFINSLQQEQPETDLEKEIANWLEKGDITDTRFDDYSDLDIERTAHHFYELGLNARKV